MIKNMKKFSTLIELLKEFLEKVDFGTIRVDKKARKLPSMQSVTKMSYLSLFKGLSLVELEYMPSLNWRNMRKKNREKR